MVGAPEKVSVGIAGLDAILTGGVPAGEATLVTGGPGAGKTVLASQVATHWAANEGPTLYVAFEESPHSIVANTRTFDWHDDGVVDSTLHFIDAQPTTRAVFAGSFSLDGLFASLRAVIEEHGIRFVVLDGVDQLLDLLPSPLARRRQFLQLLDTLSAWALTGLITVKRRDGPRDPDYVFMQYAMQCVLRLENGGGTLGARRSLTVVKFRGSRSLPGMHPFVIDGHGLSVAGSVTVDDAMLPDLTERVSTGVVTLDGLLGGGLFRGTATLVSGAPGTAKTSLAAAFLAEGAARGERGLCVSFEEPFERIAANVASVGIDLATPAKEGLIGSLSLMPRAAQPEELYLAVMRASEQSQPSRVVVDPLSALVKSGEEGADAERLLERLFRLLKSQSTTVLVTSLVDPSVPGSEQSLSGLSAIADTWIELSYHRIRGERVRGLSIVKSRGTAHSSQVRELILSADGIALAAACTVDGEVLMSEGRRQRFPERQTAQEGEGGAAVGRREAVEREIALNRAELSAVEERLKRLEVELQTVDRQAAQGGETP